MMSLRCVNSREGQDEELVANIFGDESDHDFVDEDKFKSDEGLKIVSNSVFSDRGNVDSPAPLTPSSEISDASAKLKSLFAYTYCTSSELSHE